MTQAPQTEGDAPAGGVDTGTLARITELENREKHSKTLISFVSDTNKFILVVIFIGFIALLVTIILIVLNAVISDTAAREELTTQVKVLTSEVERLNK